MQVSGGVVDRPSRAHSASGLRTSYTNTRIRAFVSFAVIPLYSQRHIGEARGSARMMTRVPGEGSRPETGGWSPKLGGTQRRKRTRPALLPFLSLKKIIIKKKERKRKKTIGQRATTICQPTTLSSHILPTSFGALTLTPLFFLFPFVIYTRSGRIARDVQAGGDGQRQGLPTLVANGGGTDWRCGPCE